MELPCLCCGGLTNSSDQVRGDKMNRKNIYSNKQPATNNKQQTTTNNKHQHTNKQQTTTNNNNKQKKNNKPDGSYGSTNFLDVYQVRYKYAWILLWKSYGLATQWISPISVGHSGLQKKSNPRKTNKWQWKIPILNRLNTSSIIVDFPASHVSFRGGKHPHMLYLLKICLIFDCKHTWKTPMEIRV